MSTSNEIQSLIRSICQGDNTAYAQILTMRKNEPAFYFKHYANTAVAVLSTEGRHIIDRAQQLIPLPTFLIDLYGLLNLMDNETKQTFINFVNQCLNKQHLGAVYIILDMLITGKAKMPPEMTQQLIDSIKKNAESSESPWKHFIMGLLHLRGLHQQNRLPDFAGATAYFQECIDHDAKSDAKQYAHHQLGLLYETAKAKSDMTAPDFSTAKLHYLEAIKFHHTESMIRLATLYRDGKLSSNNEPDYKTAMETMRKAAALGNGTAASNIAIMVLQGHTESKKVDREQAKTLLDDTIERFNNPEAMCNRATLHHQDKAFEQAETLFSRAEQMGYHLASKERLVNLVQMLSEKNQKLTSENKELAEKVAKISTENEKFQIQTQADRERIATMQDLINALKGSALHSASVAEAKRVQ